MTSPPTPEWSLTTPYSQERALDDVAERGDRGGERPLGLEHPELGEVPRGLGALGAEAGREGVYAGDGRRHGFEVELGRDGEVGGVGEIFRGLDFQG